MAPGDPGTPTAADDREEIIRLRALVDSFAQLNSSLDLDQVLKNTLTTATALMRAEIGSIALVNDEKSHLIFVESTDKNFDKLKNLTVPLGEGIAGDVAQTGKPVRVEDVHKDERFYGKIDEKLGQTTQSYLCVPLIAREEVIGTAQIMNRLDGQSFTTADTELMQGFARQAALAIHNAKMHKIMLEQKAIESELQVCAQIQRNIFPEESPAVQGFELHGASVPSSQVGGDYFTYIDRGNGTFDVIIADVSGHGLAAAMMVSEMHTGIHLLSQMDYSLDQTIAMLNEHLVEAFIVGKFITMFAARLTAGSNRIEYVLAGHPSPHILNHQGRCRELDRTGLPLGIDKTPRPEMSSFEMEQGELLVAFTDGYSEAANEQEELFEEDRIRDIAAGNVELNLPDIVQRLDHEVRQFTNNAPPVDDATLLLLRHLNP